MLTTDPFDGMSGIIRVVVAQHLMVVVVFKTIIVEREGRLALTKVGLPTINVT